MIDWYSVDIRKIQIRQPPGERNALGNIKFMFPNQYDVYLHDTPSKSLFQRDYRAFSHGCMRVMDPMAFADALLAERARPQRRQAEEDDRRPGTHGEAHAPCAGPHHLFHRLRSTNHGN